MDVEVHKELQKLIDPHINSFNFCLNEGLKLAVSDLDPVIVEGDAIDERKNGGTSFAGKRMVFRMEDVTVGYPVEGREEKPVFPHTCRESRSTYCAPIYANLILSIYNSPKATSPSANFSFQKRLGMLPIMLRVRFYHILNSLLHIEYSL